MKVKGSQKRVHDTPPGTGEQRTWVPSIKHSLLLRYGIATLAVAAVILLKLLLDPLITEQSPFLLMAGAVMVGAWFGGLGPGVLATVIGALAAEYFFLEPVGSFTGPGGGLLPFTLFVLQGLLISVLVEALHSSRQRAETRALEIRRKQGELRESEERFRTTFEQAAVGVAHVGPDGRWLRVNNRLCEITGYPRDELQEMTFQDITHPDDLRKDLEHLRRLSAGEIRTYTTEKRYLRKDGSFVWINLTVSAVADASGQLKYFITVVEDISERKNAEEA